MNGLEVKDVSIKYGKTIALKPCSFTLESGTITGFIGADGAGKSSLLNAIAGVMDFAGQIVFSGYAYHSARSSEHAKKYIGLMPQGLGLILYNSLSVEQHLDYFSRIREIDNDSKFSEFRESLLLMSGLKPFLDRQAANLSGGMRQKLALICTLLHKPKLLLLDEPTTGVDPISRYELWNILTKITKEEQMLVIVSSAYMQEAGYMDKLILFEEGEIICQDSKEELLTSVKNYCYEPVDDLIEGIKTVKHLYSLKDDLKIEHKKPELESVFFVNWLKGGRKFPKISIENKRIRDTGSRYVLKAENITKKFNQFVALDRVSLNLNSKEILGLLGPNGAGKTTFMKILLGLLPYDGGSLEMLNVMIKSYKDRLRLKSRIGYVSQRFALYRKMTIKENLIYFGTLYGIKKRELEDKINEYSRILNFNKWINYFADDVPMGIKQRFSLCAALLHEPRVLILDEPTSGIDVIARELFWEILQQIKDNWNISVIISTHYMSEAEFCDRVVLLKDGVKIADDTVGNLYGKYPEAKNFEEIFLKYYNA